LSAESVGRRLCFLPFFHFRNSDCKEWQVLIQSEKSVILQGYEGIYNGDWKNYNDWII